MNDLESVWKKIFACQIFEKAQHTGFLFTFFS